MFEILKGDKGEMILDTIILVCSILGFIGSALLKDPKNETIFLFNIFIWTSLLVMSIKKYRRTTKK